MAPHSRRSKGSIAVPLILVLALVVAAAPAAAAPPPIRIATGQDAGWPDVRAWNRFGDPAQQLAPWGFDPIRFSAYPTYQGGVRVAVGDVDGDGAAEIVTAPAAGGWTELRVFDGRTFAQRAALLPFRDGVWWNGAFVATGDTNGDGRAEIVDGLDAGCCTTLHVLDGATGAESAGFFPFGNGSERGARVASADLNGDGRAELLAVSPGSSAVDAFGVAGGEPFRTYQVFGDEAPGGATIAAGDLLGGSRPELVAAASTPGGVHVKLLDAESGSWLASFFPYGPTFGGSAQVAVGDVNGDGRNDVVVLARLADGTQVRVVNADGSHQSAFYVLEPGVVPGASLAVGDLDGDGKAEIVLGGGPSPNAPAPPAAGRDQRVAVYRGNGTLVGAFTAYPGLFQGGVRVAVADVERNGRPDVITAPGPGMEPEVELFGQQWSGSRDRGTRFGHFLAFERSFTGGVSVAAGYWSGNPELVAVPGPGRAPEVRVFDPRGRLLSSFPAFEPSYRGGLSVAVGDLTADGRPEVVVGTLAPPARIRVFDVAGWQSRPQLAPFAADGAGVQVGVADVRGDGRGLIVAGESTGPNPLLVLVDPRSGQPVATQRVAPSATNGLRVGAGDLDLDGRDEILAATAWGGDGDVRVLGPALREKWSLWVYSWAGGGMNVAAAARLGLPLRADGLTFRLRQGVRARVVVGRFHDVARSTTRFRATIDWGDGTEWRGVVIRRAAGTIDVRSAKRYARRGTYKIEVRLADSSGRVSIARSTAVVRG